MFPKVIKAAGDPDDLGPGSNHDESLPELMMQPSLDPGAGFDSSGDSMTHHPSSHSELELLHNVPSVCLSSPPQRPALTSPFRKKMLLISLRNTSFK